MAKGHSSHNQRSGTTLAEKLTYYSDRSGGPDACWPWIGAMSKNGYGTMLWQGKTQRAHKLSWEDANGRKAGAGLNICHRCDNRPCINPAHLFAGSQKDNIRDMLIKNRGAVQRGDRYIRHRLSVMQIREIQASAATMTALAAIYGTTRQTISAIRQSATDTKCTPPPSITLGRC